MTYTEFYAISRACMIIFYYIVLSVIGDSFNPFKWNDVASIMCIGLEFGMFVDIIVNLNRFHKE